uniref:Alpha/beta hydrolase n=1 Tax=uncultured Thiotrichaceae bacterium TaxID=298394 RepID=A0A6S6S0V0_9GAMM|nr:MAG: Alpha/beta hydrolase [uncultured Thiotrichaceae bacterium]
MKTVFTLTCVFFMLSNLCSQTKEINTLSTSPYEVHTVELSEDLRVAYVDEGTNDRVLLFVHGLGSSLQAWNKNIETLKKDYRCIALDLPGYGQSSMGDYSFKTTFFGETVLAFMKKLELENVVLVGHSMGGHTAIQTVLANDENVEKLVLVAPAGFEVFIEGESQFLKNYFTPTLVKSATKEQVAKNVEINFHKMPDDAQFMIDDRLALEHTPAFEAYCEMIPKCIAGMLDEPVFDQLSTIKIPTLILFGENDGLIPNRYLHPALNPAQVATNGHEQITNSKLILLPETGHFVQWEQAAKFNEYLVAFLEE